MSYTSQHRIRSSHQPTVVSYSPVCLRHQVTEKLIQHDGSSEGGSLFYSTPTHQQRSSTCTSYGTLYQHQPNTATHLQLLEMSTPSSSEDCSNTFVLQTSTNKPLAWCWLISCFLVLTNNLFTLLQPFWLQNKQTGASIGFINFCAANEDVKLDGEQCNFYGANSGTNTFSAKELPLQLTLILYILATVFLSGGSVLAAVCICVTNYKRRGIVSFIGGYLQLFSAVFYLTSLIMYPVGFDDSSVRDVCGKDSDVFSPGACHIGWSYALAIAGSALCSLLPTISHYINKYEFKSIDTNHGII